jgi:hypothetical protein
MSNKAERWLAEQEVALLERIFELESPPDAGDERDVMRVEALKVRLWRPTTHRPQPHGNIGG